MPTTDELQIIVRVRDFASREFSKIQGGITGMTGGVKSLSASLGSFRMLLADVATLVAPFLAIAYALGRIAKVGIDFNATIETAKLGIASIIATNAQIVDASGKQLTGQEKLNAAQEQSLTIVRYLQKAGLETAATTEQLVEAYQQAVGPGLAVRMNLQQIAELTVRIVQAAGAIGVPMVQLNEEVRSILSGQINMNSRVAKTLGLTNEMVASWKTQGVLFDKLMEKMGQFGIAGDAVANTWAGITSNLKETWQVLMGGATAGLFEGMKKSMNSAFAGVFDTKTLGVSETFKGLADGMKGVFTDIGAGIGATIAWIMDGMKSLSKWIKENHKVLSAMWELFKAIGKVVIELAGQLLSVAGAVIKCAVESRLLFTVFKAINLLIAGIADFIDLVKLGIHSLEFILDEVLVKPLAMALYWGGRLADFLGNKELGKQMMEIGNGLWEGTEQNRLAMVNLANQFAEGNTHTAKAIKLNADLTASLDRVGKKAKEVAKDLGNSQGTTVIPLPLDLTDDQKKKVEDFLGWYRSQMATMKGEQAALHGDEAAAMKAQYVKVLEEIASKRREFAKEGLVEQAGMSPEALAKVRQAQGALSQLRLQARQVYGDKVQMLDLQTQEKVAELTNASDEKIHEAKLARIREQYSANDTLRDAYLSEENRKYALATIQKNETIASLTLGAEEELHQAKLAHLRKQYESDKPLLDAYLGEETQRHFEALRDRAEDYRRFREDLSAMNLVGSDRDIADLQKGYLGDLANVKKLLDEKKIAWGDYFDYVLARQQKLSEDMKKINGSMLDGMKDALRDYVDKAKNSYETGRDLFNNVTASMERTGSDFFFNLAKGGRNYTDIFRNLGNDLLKTWSDMISKMVMKAAMNGLSSLLDGASAYFGAGGAAGGGRPGQFGGPTGPQVAYAANGAVWEGGFRPFRAFASGGVVNRPTLGLIGEGRFNEAIVPLPDGKSIPVKMRGGNQGGTTIVNHSWTINTPNAEGVEEAIMRKKSTIEGIVYDALARGGALRDAVRRYR